MAKIEIPKESFPIFFDDKNRGEIIDKLKALGYKYVSLDLEGFRSGSLNEVLQK